MFRARLRSLGNYLTVDYGALGIDMRRGQPALLIGSLKYQFARSREAACAANKRPIYGRSP